MGWLLLPVLALLALGTATTPPPARDGAPGNRVADDALTDPGAALWGYVSLGRPRYTATVTQRPAETVTGTATLRIWRKRTLIHTETVPVAGGGDYVDQYRWRARWSQVVSQARRDHGERSDAV